jgi:pimeloyl-ACP methyl ester carboxylesterase
VVVGVSLGGQLALSLLAAHPGMFAAAVISGASINPPDEVAGWEMPRMPSADEGGWMEVMMQDVGILGMENAEGVKRESLAFRFPAEDKGMGSEERGDKGMPPTLAVVGERDVSMAKRDFGALLERVRGREEGDGDGRVKSRGLVMPGAWHNHPIDVPEAFARVIVEWVRIAVLGEKVGEGSVLAEA